MAFAASVPPLAEAGEEHFIQALLPDPPESTKRLKQLALVQSANWESFHSLREMDQGNCV